MKGNSRVVSKNTDPKPKWALVLELALTDESVTCGERKGTATGESVACQNEGCTGRRMEVRWEDGEVTNPCSTTFKNDGNHWIIVQQTVSMRVYKFSLDGADQKCHGCGWMVFNLYTLAHSQEEADRHHEVEEIALCGACMMEILSQSDYVIIGKLIG